MEPTIELPGLPSHTRERVYDMWGKANFAKNRLKISGPVIYTTSSCESKGWNKEMRALNALVFPDWDGRDSLPPSRKGHIWVLARTKGHNILVGYAFVYWIESVEDEVDAIVEQIAVDPAWQGKGVGRRLIAEAASTAQRLGARRLAAAPLVGLEEERRRRWLIALGFTSPWGRGLTACPSELIESIRRLDEASST